MGPVIGRTVSALMDEKRLSQGQVAAMAGLTQPAIHRLVTGKTDDPSISVLTGVARALGVTLDQLLAGVARPQSVEADVRDLQVKMADLLDRVAPLLELAAEARRRPGDKRAKPK